jgi:hypothetical protein
MNSVSEPAKVLTPDDATEVLEELRSGAGLGDKYKLDVDKQPDGHWRITHDGKRVDSVPPMTAGHVEDWFDKQFGDVVTDRLETSEG